MTWKVDAKQWLEDFTSVARQQPQVESFDQVDERVRRALGDEFTTPTAPPAEPQRGADSQPALVIPAMVATGAGTSSSSGTIPRLTTRTREPSEPKPPAAQIPPMTRAAAEKKAVSGEIGTPSATQSGVLVVGEIGGDPPRRKVRASDSMSGEIGAVTKPRTRKVSEPKSPPSVIIPSLTRSDEDAEAVPITPAPRISSAPTASSPNFIDSIFDEEEDEEDADTTDATAATDAADVDVDIEQVDEGEPSESKPVQTLDLPVDDDEEQVEAAGESEDSGVLLVSVDDEIVDASEVSTEDVVMEPRERQQSGPPPVAPPTPPPRSKAPKSAPPAPKSAPPAPPPRPKSAARQKAPPQPPKRAEPKQPRKPWYEDAFTEHYAAIEPLDHDISAEFDVDFIIESARLSPQMSILDVGCGNGHHLCMLRKRGFTELHGVDSSLPQILRASQKAEKVGGGINLFQGDMRSLPTERTFDAVLCLGTTFGYFEDEANQQVLAGLSEQVSPGGRLVLQVMNGAHWMNFLPCRSWWQGRACLVLDVADMNPFQSRVQVHRTVVFEDGRQFEYRMSIRAYTLHELVKMFKAVGLKIVELSGCRDTRGRFYNVSSPDIWIVAQRSGE